jgi:selenocysteine lyase/cysteine desulfurase
VLAVAATVLVLVAVGLLVVAFITYRDAQDSRDATRPLEARAAALRVDLAGANRAVDRLTELFAAIRTQADATKTAVDTTNQAAVRYNQAERRIADALGAEASDAVAALAQATTAVRAAADEAKTAVTALGGDGG